MSCINDELIQKYYDGEATQSEILLVKNHISGCEKCSLKIDAQKKLANSIKRAINLLNEGEIKIPDLAILPYRKKTIQIKPVRRVLAIAAACILILMLVISKNKNPDAGKEIIFVTGFQSEIDANRTISQQELVINMIDSDGNISESHF